MFYFVKIQNHVIITNTTNVHEATNMELSDQEQK